jgi:hypothetical protein
MIKIANNLEKLIKHSNNKKDISGLDWLGLGVSGLIGGGLAKATQIHNKHWARQADGSYIRRLSYMADRDNPRPYAYDPKGIPIPDDIADDLYVKKSPAQPRLRVDPNELGNTQTPPAQPRLRVDPNELGNTQTPPAQPRLRVDPNELGNTQTPPAQPRLRVDPNELGNAAPTIRPRITWRGALRRALTRR